MNIKIAPAARELVDYIFDDNITIEDIINYLNSRLQGHVEIVQYCGAGSEENFNPRFCEEGHPFNANYEVQYLRLCTAAIEEIYLIKTSHGFSYKATWYHDNDKIDKILTELIYKLNKLRVR